MLDHQSILDKHYLSGYESVLGGISGNTYDLHKYLYCVANQNSQFPTWLINFDLKDQFLNQMHSPGPEELHYIKANIKQRPRWLLSFLYSFIYTEK